MAPTRRLSPTDPGHADWVVDCCIRAARALKVSPEKLTRSQMTKGRTARDHNWPCWMDFQALGGWFAVRDRILDVMEGKAEATPTAYHSHIETAQVRQPLVAPPVAEPEPMVAEVPVSPRVRGGEPVTEPEPPPADALEIHRFKAKMAELKEENKALLKRLDVAERRVLTFTDIQRGAPDMGVTRRERTFAQREATAVAMASDWHVEEVVDPMTIEGRNAYDLDVAEARAHRFFEGVVWMLDFSGGAFKIRDLILWLGGDLISGYIHDELVEGNALSPTMATRFARQLIVWGINYLLAECEGIETIHVLCNHGNHGRTTEKRRIQTAADNSYEHMMYHFLADDFRDNPRVKFTIARGAHLYYPVYDLMTRWHHGDDVRYQGGVGGIDIPLNKAMASWESFKHADITNIGHFHQYRSLQDKTVNGSLVGYNPYALSVKAQFEPPQQAFYLIDSKRGKCMKTPLWVHEQDAKGSDPRRSEAIRKMLLERDGDGHE